MARISQYKALGTGLGGYKTTLSKVQSMEYAKKHADWKAGEQKSLYKEIGSTVSNILGIAKEKHLLNEQKARQQKYDDKYLPLDNPDRPKSPLPEMYSPEELTAEDMPSDMTSDFDASGDTTATVAGKDDPYGYEEGVEYMTVPGYDKMGVNLQKKEETKVDFSGAVTAGQGATQYKKITSKPDYRDMIKKQIGADTSYEDKLMAGWEAEDKALGMYPELYQDKKKGLSSPTAAETTAYEQYQQSLKGSVDLSEKSKRTGLPIDEIIRREKESQQSGEQASQGGQAYYVDEFGNRSPSRLDDTPVDSPESTESQLYEKYGAHPDDLGVDAKSRALNAPLDPVSRPKVTDSYYGAEKEPIIDDVSVVDPMSFLKDEFLGDFSTDQLPPTMIEQQFIDRMKERGINISLKEISELVNQFASVETGGKDIRQITPEDVKAGRKEGTGKGAGFFQFETGKDMGFETGLNRVENMYKDRDKKVPDWVEKARKEGSPIGLPKHIQRELLLANLYQQEQSYGLSGSKDKQGNIVKDKRFDIMARAFKSGDFSELWAKKHWAGADEEYEGKIEQFKRDKGRYKF